MPRVAIATCSELPALDDDEASVLAPLIEAGVAAEPVVWDAHGVDWSVYDAVVIRATWDYWARRTEFVNWAKQVPVLFNNAAVVEWNTDKRYLNELAAHGIRTIDTEFMSPGDPVTLPSSGLWVLKPTVGAGSRFAGKYDLSSTTQRALAYELVRDMHANSRTAMMQPYLTDIDAQGEKALIFIDGQYSHAINKGAMLSGPYRESSDLYKEEKISRETTTDAQQRFAAEVLANIPTDDPPLYARIDIVTHDNEPLLMEAELVEPSLYYRFGETAVPRFVNAILARLD